MKNRILLVFFFLFCAWMGLLAKGLFLQVLPNDRLADLQKKQFEKIVTLKPRRGVVSDRNGKELAVTVASFSLFADPTLITKPQTVARKLNKYLGLSYRTIYKKLLSKKRRFVWIKRQLNKKQKMAISSWKYRGLGFIEEPKRVYPGKNVLSQLLGFVGRDGQGLEGLEHFYDEVLSGRTEHLQIRKDARGRPLLINGQVFTEFPDGSNLDLTINANVQFFLERELQHAIDKHDADSALGVVVDSNTGEILALANSPGYDSNGPSRYSHKIRRNRVLLDAFEPGSTMKTFVVAAALKEGVAKPNTKYFCENGKFKVGDRVISEADRHHSFGWLTVSEILAQSSNIGSAKLAFDLGDKKFRSFLEEFGFGKKLGIDFGSESKGILQSLPWRKHLLSNVAFGHGISVTPLQLAMAYVAIANGGKLMQPMLIKSIRTEMDEVLVENTPKVIREVLPEKVASNMRLLLMSATAKKATGYSARIKGFPVAGKTGTAQKVDTVRGGYIKGAYIASFAGFVPANKPQFVIYVAVDNPRGAYYGSQVAAPIFSRVASYLVRQEGLEPILISDRDIVEDVASRPNKKTKGYKNWIEGTIPDLKGLTLREAIKRIKGKGIELDIQGSGTVSKTWPEAGEAIPKSKRLKVKMNNNK